MTHIVYGSPGLFDMGGIARYGRHQVHALRRLVGPDKIDVVSMLGPQPGGFDEPIDVDFAAGGKALHNKLAFAAACAVRSGLRRIYWSAHINYAPIVVPLSSMTGGCAVVNIYGLEIWSNRSRLKEMCLHRAWVIADCHATLEAAISMGIVDKDRAMVIHDPVDVDFFSPGPPDPGIAAKYGLPLDGRFRVLFVGRLDEGSRHKGPDRLIAAFSKARLPANAELVIAGSGSRLQALKDYAAELGVAERVKLIGRVADNDLPAIYRAASIFALVSQKYHGGGEGIPLTPLEAGACGIAAIVGDEDGSREVCVSGESGIMVPSRDEGELVKAVEALAADPVRTRRMGEAAADRCKRWFSLERFIRQHDEFLRRIGSGELIVASQ
jgi:phosphatidylinositol alpha-1,6-mannosyltransferase